MSEKPVSGDTALLFEAYRLDHRSGLSRKGLNGRWEPIFLGSRALALLWALAERSGQLVLKTTLMDAVWPGTAVEDSNLTVQISAVRRALDMGRAGGSCIRTVPGRGYRFLPAVTTETDAGSAPDSDPRPIPSGMPPSGMPRSGLPLSSGPTIAVLPFEGSLSVTSGDHLRDDLADDIITELSRHRSVFVVAQTSSFALRDRSWDVKQIARELGADYVIDGSTRREGGKVRINARLVDAGTGTHVWVEQFELETDSTVTTKDEMIGRVVRVLILKIAEDVNRRIEAVPREEWTPNLLIMRGHAYTYRPISDSNRIEAIRCFGQALDGDPNSIDAMLGIAWVLIGNVADGWSRSIAEDTARAEQLLLAVLLVNGDIAQVHLLMGVLRRLQGRLDEARHELEKAIEIAPHNPRAMCQLGFTLALLGRPDLGIPHIEKGLRIAPRDPASPAIWFALGTCHLLLEHVDEAVTCFRRSRAENPWPVYAHLGLAAALGLNGELDEAAACLRRVAEIMPVFRSISSVRTLPGHVRPQYLAMFDKTLGAGLRRAGLPDE